MRDSSSSEEDLSKFQSVAVSAEDVAESARKQVQAAAQRRNSTNHNAQPSQKRPTTADADVAATIIRSKCSHAEQEDNAELDLVSLKIAAALDAMLARQLDIDIMAAPAPAGPVAALRQKANTQLSSTASLPSFIQSSAAVVTGSNDEDAFLPLDNTTGVRLFRRVKPGTPCVLHDGSAHQQRLAGVHPVDAYVAQLSGRKRHAHIHDHIPRFNLAAKSSSSKKQREQVLAALAVDGAALLAAAPWALQQEAGSNSNEATAVPANAGANGKMSGKSSSKAKVAVLAAWKQLHGGKRVEGVVLEDKQFVPHDVRITKLLGKQ